MIGFRVQVPKAKFTEASLKVAFRAVAKRLVKRVGKTYDIITETWENKPIFNQLVRERHGRIEASVKTDAPHYAYVTLGTKPHVIAPRPDNPRGMLVFGTTFTPKTAPRELYSVEGGKAPPIAFISGAVEHPGVEAREYEKEIAKWEIEVVTEDLKETLGNEIRVETEIL